MQMPEWLMDLRIDKSPFLIGVTVIAAFGIACVLVGRPSKRWLLTVAVSVLLGGAIGWGIAWLLSDVMDVFGLPLTTVTRLWVASTFAGIFLAVASMWRAGWWRIVVAGVCIPVIVITAAAWINVDFGAYRNLNDALGVDPYPALNLASQSGNDAPADPQLARDWHPPTDMPARGRIGTVRIPATVSGFNARPAEVYLPPAALVSDPPILPVIEMFSGQPGSPIDIFESARFATYLNAYATAHNGLAPIVVVPDQLSAPEHNPMCVDSPLGRSATYLTVDVPNWIQTHLRVGSDRSSWAIGGYSQGGTCSIQFGAGHPERYGTILDIAGEVAPTIGAQTIQKGFAGSASAYHAALPLTLLAKNAPFTHTFGIFGVGQDDTRYGPELKTVATAAARAGMKTQLIESPGSGHDWNTVRYVLQRAVSPLAADLGL
jgi:enterochelin esterase-like enzyme